MTTLRSVLSVSVPVADQDRALDFYRDVLGREVRADLEVWPGARLVEVVPSGSSVADPDGNRLIYIEDDGPTEHEAA